MRTVHKVRLRSATEPIKVSVISNTGEQIKTHSNQYGSVTVIGKGSNDYDVLINKPRINGVTLQGNKSSEEIGIEEISNMELDALFNSQF